MDASTSIDQSLDPVVLEAQKRFTLCKDWEQNCRKLFIEDYKFCEADAYNGYQWPNSIRRNRDLDLKPCLTINKTRQHCLQIINDAKQNKPGIKIRGVGGGATADSALMYMALARHMEYQSKATTIYDVATTFQVKCGVGYARVKTDYVDEKSFNQEILLEAVPDPLTIYMDPDAKQRDKSDARYAFVFEDIPQDQFDEKYGKYRGTIGGNDVLGEPTDWINKDHVKVCEYYRVVEEEDTLYLVQNIDTGDQEPILKSDMPADIHRKLLIEQPNMRSRSVSRKVVEYYFIVGDKIIEENVWIGKDIPIVPLLGEETIIMGEMDRKGHTRAMVDPQRMYNYWSSSAVEYGALQTKTPWLAAAESIEGYETYWNNANEQNTAVLTYKATREDGTPLPPPVRVEPPTPAPVALTGMEIAGREMEMVSGQYQAQMGAPSNERSGKAITERQRQGDKATYHYIDNMGIFIRRIGEIFIDLVPKVYDTEQVLSILGDDGKDMEVTIDPYAKVAYQQQVNEDNIVVKRVLNPRIGKYQVQADIGPSYATRREEAWNAITLILTQAPDLAQYCADLLFDAGDFEYAEKIAERLRKGGFIPAAALGQGPTQSEMALQQQLQMLTGELQKMKQELDITRLKLHGKEQQKDIDVFKALTERIKVLGDQHVSGLELAHLMDQTIAEAESQNLEPVVKSAESEMASQMPQETPPVMGAQKAPDGQWYVPDRVRPGKFLRVERPR